MKKPRILFLSLWNSFLCGPSYEKLINIKPSNKTNCIISFDTCYMFRSYWLCL